MPEVLSGTPPLRPASHTKIVATLGPASDSPEMLRRLLTAGVDVFRINTAHGAPQEHSRLLNAVRQAGVDAGVSVGVLVDLAGPKMRLGKLPDDEVVCQIGDEICFVRGEASENPSELTCGYATLIDELSAGDRILLADGTVALEVERVEPARAICRVQQGGTVRSRQGVNLPGVKLLAATLGDRDREAAVWAANAGVDFLGLSFVRRADDIHELRQIIDGAGSETQIVAKIEKPEALTNLDAIISATDAVMVARGDLGVEIDIARIAVVQKQIVAACRKLHRPVIIATQMLDSMHGSRLPSRAEATDVANAILDGADACMLSGETAVGDYPVEAVEMMHRIALATESFAIKQDLTVLRDEPDPEFHPITEAVTTAAAAIAEQLEARLIVVATVTGRSALGVSQQRTFVPIIGVSDSPAVLRRMSLFWGVVPIPAAPAEPDELLNFLTSNGLPGIDTAPGDRVVMVVGTKGADDRHNAVIVHQV